MSAVFAASGDLGNFSGYRQGTPDYERAINIVHDAAIKAGVKLCGPFAWRDRPDFSCFQNASETAAIARGVAAELGPLANTQPVPEVGPYARRYARAAGGTLGRLPRVGLRSATCRSSRHASASDNYCRKPTIVSRGRWIAVRAEAGTHARSRARVHAPAIGPMPVPGKRTRSPRVMPASSQFSWPSCQPCNQTPTRTMKCAQRRR